MNFEQLGVIPTILTAIEKQGYTQATPIQEKSIPIVLNRSDLIGCAQTGTGKTAAFSIPILQLLYESPERKKHGKIRSLIVTSLFRHWNWRQLHLPTSRSTNL